MIYVDTSLLVPLFVTEPQSAGVRAWFKSHIDDVLAISDWTLVEFSSAMGIKVRRKELKAEQALQACRILRESAEEGMEVLSPGRSTFSQAADLLGHFSSGLRAGDALHLSAALDAEATSFCTLDERLIEACRKIKVGIRVANPVGRKAI